ncbi:MAG TPA: alkyl hydroperoxide reductase subunit F, partial [Pseudomonadales bacterium]|nr:alkyl hydroperoxide reductase subunit F [Pseudomonadales bacterium]
MLDTNVKAQLEQYIALLENPIELVMAPDASNTSLEMRNLLQEIAALSDKIRFREDDDSQQRAPSFSVARLGEAPRIRFAGI